MLDGIEDVLGENGLNALLNYGNISKLIGNKPDYSFDENFTDEEYAAITSSIQAVFRFEGLQGNNTPGGRRHGKADY